MFLQQIKTNHKPFYHPVNLKHIYPDIKDLKVYDCNKDEEKIPESIVGQIYY
jgi:hypothetical protein